MSSHVDRGLPAGMMIVAVITRWLVDAQPRGSRVCSWHLQQTGYRTQCVAVASVSRLEIRVYNYYCVHVYTQYTRMSATTTLSATVKFPREATVDGKAAILLFISRSIISRVTRQAWIDLFHPQHAT